MVEGLQLVRCEVCGLTYYNPDVDPEDHYALLNQDFFVAPSIQKIQSTGKYDFDAYMSNVKDPSVIGYPDYLEPQHLQAKELWGKKVLGWFIKEWQKQGFKGMPSSILELGGATGHMLVPFKEAEWTVCAQEVSPWIAQYAAPGVEMKLGEIHLLDFGTRKFNCILAWDSFEHVQHPNECLRKLFEVTTDEMLMVMQTPDANYATSDWYLFSPAQHAFLWSRKTISLILEKNGFCIVEEKLSSQADEAIYLISKKPGIRKKGAKS